MKNNILDQTFNTEKTSIKQVTKEVKNLPAIINVNNTEDAQKYVIETYVDIIDKGKIMLNKAMEQIIASDTTQFEFKDLAPIATLMNALSLANDKLNNNIKPVSSNNTIDPKKGQPVVNNNVLIATTEEIINKLNK